MSGTSKVAGSPRPPRSEGTRRAGPAPGAGGLSTCRPHAGSRSREEEVGEGRGKGREGPLVRLRNGSTRLGLGTQCCRGGRPKCQQPACFTSAGKETEAAAGQSCPGAPKGSRHSGWTLVCCLRGRKATSESATSGFSKGQGQVTQVGGVSGRTPERRRPGWELPGHRLGKWVTVINSHRVRASQA